MIGPYNQPHSLRTLEAQSRAVTLSGRALVSDGVGRIELFLCFCLSFWVGSVHISLQDSLFSLKELSRAVLRITALWSQAQTAHP